MINHKVQHFFRREECMANQQYIILVKLPDYHIVEQNNFVISTTPLI